MTSPRVRPATPGDLDNLLAIHVAAFPDARSMAARQRNFEQNPLGPLASLRVLDVGGEALAHAFLFSLVTFFRGRSVATAGIASLGVAPHARGRGLAAYLMSALEDEARQRGDVLALLHPFRQGFYRRLGYAPVAPTVRLEASPAAIPEDWVSAARSASLRAATGQDRASVEACYVQYAHQSSGLFERPERLWEQKHLCERRHVVVLPGGEGVRGYAAFTHEQREPHAAVRLDVEEIVAIDDECKRLLLGALGSQRDQVRLMTLPVAADDPTAWALVDADQGAEGTALVEHPIGTLAAGPMIKILDLPRALDAAGAPTAGILELDVGVGAPHRWGADGVEKPTRLTTTLPRLASLLFGGLDASAATRLGWLEGSHGASELLEEVTLKRSFEVLDPF